MEAELAFRLARPWGVRFRDGEIVSDEAVKNRDISDTTDVDKKVANLLKPMARVETKGGYLNVFETLANPDVSWSLKRKIYETQIKTALEWLANKDLEESTKQAQKQQEPGETR